MTNLSYDVTYVDSMKLLLKLDSTKPDLTSPNDSQKKEHFRILKKFIEDFFDSLNTTPGRQRQMIAVLRHLQKMTCVGNVS